MTNEILLNQLSKDKALFESKSVSNNTLMEGPIEDTVEANEIRDEYKHKSVEELEKIIAQLELDLTQPDLFPARRYIKVKLAIAKGILSYKKNINESFSKQDIEEKTYTIAKSRTGKPDMLQTGTLSELIEYYSYTLECGKDYEHEKGNRKINTNPKNIKSLITNLNNAVNNAASNGYSDTSFELVDNKDQEKNINESDDFEVNLYKVKVKHDGGIINITTAASSEDGAKEIIMKAEGCAECAILSIIKIKKLTENVDDIWNRYAAEKEQAKKEVNSLEAAKKILPNVSDFELQHMIKALGSSVSVFQNDIEDWKRFYAAKIILKSRKKINEATDIAIKKADKIINDLKAIIKTHGYSENLGQDELNSYKQWLDNKSGKCYQEASKLYDSLSDRIDNL